MYCCMRTTVRLDPELLKAAKRYATEVGTTLTAVIEDGLRQLLARGSSRSVRSEVSFPTFKGDGVMPGIDLDDSAALQAAMD
jgi:hypothetical protein